MFKSRKLFDYFKITNKAEIHNGFVYKDGLNILDKPFEETGYCVPGGLYFSDEKHILKFLHYGKWLRRVFLPMYEDFKMVKLDDKYRANQIFLDKKYDLEKVSTFEYLNSIGCNLTINNNLPIKWAIQHNLIDIVKYLYPICPNKENLIYEADCGGLEMIKFLEQNSGYINTQFVIENAASSGNLEVLKYVLERNKQKYSDSYIILFKLAVSYGHVNVVNYFLDLGLDVNLLSSWAFRAACYRADFEMIKFLISKGADIHALNDAGMTNLAINFELPIVDYLLSIETFSPRVLEIVKKYRPN